MKLFLNTKPCSPLVWIQTFPVVPVLIQVFITKQGQIVFNFIGQAPCVNGPRIVDVHHHKAKFEEDKEERNQKGDEHSNLIGHKGIGSECLEKVKLCPWMATSGSAIDENAQGNVSIQKCPQFMFRYNFDTSVASSVLFGDDLLWVGVQPKWILHCGMLRDDFWKKPDSKRSWRSFKNDLNLWEKDNKKGQEIWLEMLELNVHF